MITFCLKTFDELSTTELYDCLRLRAEVFVSEQACAYTDPDGHDPVCLHLMGFDQGKLAAYARLVPPGVFYESAAIGRVATESGFRQRGYGKALMQQAMRATLEHFGTDTITISAQQYLEAFYSELGFITQSGMYLEDGIPHINMQYHVSWIDIATNV